MSTRQRRLLRPAVVCTLSVLSACKGAETSDATQGSATPHATGSAAPTASSATWNATGQHKKRTKIHDESPWDGKAVKVDFAHALTQNAVDADGRFILASGETCRIKVPPKGPPPTDLPTGVAYEEYEEVDCPSDYDDKAWDDCSYLLTRDKAGCYCLPNGGNPPPPPKAVRCPALQRQPE